MNLGAHIITRIVILQFKASIKRGDISWENPRGVVQFPEKDLSSVGKKLFEMFSLGAAHLIPVGDGSGYCLIDFHPKGKDDVYRVGIKLVFEGDRPPQNDDIWRELLLKAGFGDVETTAAEKGGSWN